MFKFSLKVVFAPFAGEDQFCASPERSPGERVLHRDVPARAEGGRRAGPARAHQRLAAHHLGAGPAQLQERGLLPPPLHQGNMLHRCFALFFLIHKLP